MALTVQVNPACNSCGSSVQQQGRLDESNLSLLNNSPYGHYSNGDANVFRTDRFDPYQSSRDSSPYIKNASERSFSSIADASTYQSYRATENSRRLSFESPSSMGRAGYGHQLDPPLYSSPGPHLHDPRVLRAPQDGFRRSSIESLSCPVNPSYSSPSAHLHVPGVPPFEHNASRTPPYDWRSPHQTTYGETLLESFNTFFILN